MRLRTFPDPLSGRNRFAVSGSQGAEAPKTVPGDGVDGTAAADGPAASGGYAVWRRSTRLPRGAEAPSQKNPDGAEAKPVPAGIRGVYRDAKERPDGPPDGRAARKTEPGRRIGEIAEKYSDDPAAGKSVAKPRRATPDTFRFVPDPRIPSTDNPAEPSPGEFVIQEYIRGCIRSEKSPKRRADIFTCFAAWKNAGVDRLAAIAGRLRPADTAAHARFGPKWGLPEHLC